jgi:hypothetical protein
MAESKNSRIAVPSFAGKRVDVRSDKSLKIQLYDSDNKYPQRVRNAINASGTATATTNLLQKHLRGNGFRNTEIETLVVNERGETLADVHRLICADRAMYRGFALHIGYNALLEINSIKHIPIEVIRLSEPDDLGVVSTVKVHPDWAGESDKAFRRADVQEFHLYTKDSEKIYEQIESAGGYDKWQGHIFYHSDNGVGTYPPAVCDAVFEDVLTDAGIKMWKFRGISTDFMANYFWIFNGEFASDEERDEYVESLNSFQGVDSSHKIVVVECPTPNAKPEIVKVEKQDNDKVYELTETTVMENIIRSYGQPLALHAIKVAGQLGLSKEWEEAKANYDERTKDERDKIGDIIQGLLGDWFEGNPADDNDYLIVPLTGLEDDQNVKPIAETLEVGKIAALQTIVTDPTMQPQQKINFLNAVFGIDYNTAAAIVNGTPLPVTV